MTLIFPHWIYSRQVKGIDISFSLSYSGRPLFHIPGRVVRSEWWKGISNASYCILWTINVIDVSSHSIVVREDAWHNFNFLKFTEVRFMTQDVVYPGEWNVPCALEKEVYSSVFGWNVLKIPMRSILSNVSFKTCVSLFIFCFHDLSIGVSGVLKSSPIIMLLSISPFMSVSVCFMYWCAPMLGE